MDAINLNDLLELEGMDFGWRGLAGMGRSRESRRRAQSERASWNRLTERTEFVDDRGDRVNNRTFPGTGWELFESFGFENVIWIVETERFIIRFKYREFLQQHKAHQEVQTKKTNNLWFWSLAYLIIVGKESVTNDRPFSFCPFIRLILYRSPRLYYKGLMWPSERKKG